MSLVVLLALAGLGEPDSTLSQVQTVVNNTGAEGVGFSEEEPYSGPHPTDPTKTMTGTVQMVLSLEAFLLPDKDGTPQTVHEDICANACVGPPPIHKNHTECNRLCDRACKGEHNFQFTGSATFNMSGAPEFLQAVVQMAETAEKRGLKIKSTASSLVGEVNSLVSRLNSQFGLFSEARTIEPGHVVSAPYEACTVANRKWIRKPYFLSVDAALSAIYAGKDQNGQNFSVPVRLMDQTFRPGYGYILANEPTIEKHVQCACIPAEKPTGTSVSGLPGAQLKDFVAGFPIGYATSFKTANPDSLGTIFKGVEHFIKGVDMNRSDLGVTSDDSALILPAGTTLFPDDDSVQNTAVIVGTIRTTFTFLSLLDGGADASGPIRTMCLNMKKKEPTTKVRFRVGGITDFSVLRLCKQIEASNRRGPWDQAKLWAYTDLASYSAIRDRVSPLPRLSLYRDGVVDVLSGGLQKPIADKLGELLDPSMVMDVSTNQNSLEFALRYLINKRPADVIRTLGTASEAFSLEKDFAPEHVKRMIMTLLSTPGDDAARALQNLLVNGIPDSLRKELKDSKEVDAINYWRHFGTPVQQAAATSILAKVQS